MTDPSASPAPSRARVFLASAAALLAAAVVLVVAVLPAEYGLDPLGTGRVLGLMSAPNADAPAATPAATSAAVVVDRRPMDVGVGLARDDAAFQIGPYDYVEYKYRLEQGATMVFAWRASAEVIHDMHGDPDGADDHAETSFDRRDLASASGTHTAPFAGLHGWMWENPGSTPITVTLTSAGFYTTATEFRPNRRRIPHTIVPSLP